MCTFLVYRQVSFYSFFVQFHFNSSVQSDKYSAVLSSFIDNMNGFGDIVLILVLFCRYWNVLLVQVKTSVLVPLPQFLGNIDFC